MIDMLVGFVLATSIGSYLTSPIAAWMPIAALAALVVLFILGLIYSFSSLLGRTEFRTWVRAKIYDTFFSLILVFIFFAVVTTFFAIPIEQSYQALNLVPQNCVSSTDFYSLSACDMHEFLSDTFTLNSFLYSAIVVIALVPSVKIDTESLFSEIASSGLGFSVEIPLSPVSVSVYFGQLLGVLFPLFALNQMQLLLLSAAPLIFAVLMAAGLTARIFGITRTFGGALIAFAMGLGLLYPLLVSLTYGFVDTGISTAVTSQCAIAGVCILNFQEWGSLIFSLLAVLITVTIGQIPGISQTVINAMFGQLIIYGGMIAVGLTLIPFLNFLVVDTFIIDFSRAIGEKMDLMSLLGSLV